MKLIASDCSLMDYIHYCNDGSTFLIPLRPPPVNSSRGLFVHVIRRLSIKLNRPDTPCQLQLLLPVY